MVKTQSLSKAVHIGTFIKKHWYLIVFLVVVIPGIINSIMIAKETNNWTYPFFDLATSIMTADAKLDIYIENLTEDPAQVIGMSKPSKGLWNNIKYYARVAWVSYKIFALVWLVFVPLFALYSIIKYLNTSTPAMNFLRASVVFIIYLFVANTVMLIYEYSQGNISFDLHDTNKFLSYALILKKVFPFHGIVSVGIYLFSIL